MTRLSSFPRRRLALIIVIAAAALSSATAVAFWTASTAPGSKGRSVSTSVDAGNVPAGDADGSDVLLSWDPSTMANGAPVSGYIVKRYPAGGGAAQTLGAGCAGTITGSTCAESNVADGSWQYTITPVVGTHWRGAESDRSPTVTVSTTPADTTAPTVVSVTSPKADGRYTAGEVIPVQVAFSEDVIVTGTPQLDLETGSTDRTIDYSTGSSTDTLSFSYTVQAGDTSSDLDYVATSALTADGGTLRDAAGNDATVTLPNPGAAGSLGSNKAIVIDTRAPSVTNVTSSNNNGAYTVGAPISIQVVFDEPVTVTGTPRLALETGATDRDATYSSGSGTNTLSFDHTVQAGETSSDLDYTSAAALSLGSGGQIDDQLNAATLTLPAPGAPGSLAADKNLVIDTVAPTVQLTAPADNSPVARGSVPVSAGASDAPSGVASVLFQYRLGTSGSFTDIGAPDTTSPYGVTWNTSSLAAGSYQLQALATDQAGNVQTSAVHTVTVPAMCTPGTFTSMAPDSYSGTDWRDTWTNSASASNGTNYGSDGTMTVYQDRVNPNNVMSHAFVAFPAPVTPANCSIAKVELKLYLDGESYNSNTTRTLRAQRVASGWSELALTWAGAQPSVDTSAQVDLLVTREGIEPGQTLTWDVTALWAAGATNGFRIHDVEPASQKFELKFGTSENSPEKRPRLVFTYG